ncbi:MAG: SDR family NAD(P)-dependent oxidoreductase [Proteobacteria bacterium]|nr:SDR family NAD(P)-dependent oxidoreductase [Pseudomonadota bacterium]
MTKNALITGATRGLGRALALDFTRRGVTVFATGRDLVELTTLAADAAFEELDVRILQADHTEPVDNARVRRTIADAGGLDVLIHNAGILGPRVELADYPEEQWDAVLDINLTAPFRLTRALIPHLNPGASVQLLSSGVGVVGRAKWGAYNVSKFGVEALGQILAAELTEQRVNVIDPGSMRTGMRAAAYPEEDPMTLVTPEENTGVFLWLALESDVTGQRFKAKDFRDQASGHRDQGRAAGA